MIRSIITYPLQFILLVFIQILVLNNVQLSGSINPFLYILFILWLPVEMNKLLVMLVAFFTGMTIDVFSDTMGMHASACVFLAFVRPYVLAALAPRDGYELNQRPSLNQFGFQWFVIYASICTFLHHLFLFFVEVFRFSEFLDTLWRTLASSFFTLVLILIMQYFNYNAESKR